MRKHLQVQLTLDLDLHPVDKVDGLVTPDLQLSPLLIQIQPGHIHQVHHAYLRKPDLRTGKVKVKNDPLAENKEMFRQLTWLCS